MVAFRNSELDASQTHTKVTIVYRAATEEKSGTHHERCFTAKDIRGPSARQEGRGNISIASRPTPPGGDPHMGE